MDLKKRIQVVKKGKTGKVPQGYSQSATIFGMEGISPTIDSAHSGSRRFAVSGQTTMTDMPAKSIENNLEIERVDLPHKIRFRRKDARMSGVQGKDIMKPNAVSDIVDNHPKWIMEAGTNPQSSMKETSEQLMLMEYQNTTFCVRDFLARVSQLLGSGEGLKILEAHSSLRYAESYGLKELAMYSLRMLKDSSLTMTEPPSKPLSERWMSWGMTANGKCLTARITEFPRIEKGCSLSDILEDNPDPKYFLSEKQVKGLLKGQMKPQMLEHCKGEDTQEDTIQE